MALPPLASVDALGAWTGLNIDPLDQRAKAVLSAASALVRNYTGQTWVDDAGALSGVPDVAEAITVQVAARVWANPAGLTSITADDTTRRWGESGASGLYLTAQEKDALGAVMAGDAPLGIGTISVARGNVGSTGYVPTSPSGPPFPWYAEE